MNYNNLYTENLPKPLSDSQLKNYFLKYKNGDLEAKNEIIKHNLRFVIYIVEMHFKNTGFDKEDLVSIGTETLIKAVDTYDVSKNIKFTTYAGRYIKNDILLFLNNNKKYLTNISLDTPLYDDNNLTWGDTLKDNQINIELDYADKDELNYYKSIILEAIDLLNARERQIINYFYYYNMTQRQIAAKLSLSRRRVYQIQRNAIKKLKTIIEEKEKNIVDFQSAGITQQKELKKCKKNVQ